MTDNSRSTIFSWAAAVLLTLVVVYPLSYALVVKWKLRDVRALPYRNNFTLQGKPTVDGARLPVYKPIDWLIDNTPMKQPLFAWATIWGVEQNFRFAAGGRWLDRLITAPTPQ